jgi:predicted PhzF superfamily epimerase YddE/YHI9
MTAFRRDPTRRTQLDIATLSCTLKKTSVQIVNCAGDAATGTAAGPLAAYLGRENLLCNDALAIEQGVKMGRRSILNVRLAPDPELSGAGLVVLRGVLASPG